VEDLTDENPLFGQRGGLLLSKRNQSKDESVYKNEHFKSKKVSSSSQPINCSSSSVSIRETARPKPKVQENPY